MVTVLTEASLIEQGVSKELFTGKELNTDLMIQLNSVNPPTKKDRTKSSDAGRRRTPAKSELGSKTSADVSEVLNYTQKAFNSQLR